MVCVDSACSQDRPQIGCWPWVWGMQTSLTSLYPGCPFWKESALIGQAILEGGEAPSPSQWSHSRAPRRQFHRRPLGTGQGGSLVGAEEAARHGGCAPQFLVATSSLLPSKPDPLHLALGYQALLALASRAKRKVRLPGPSTPVGSWPGTSRGRRAPVVMARAAALLLRCISLLILTYNVMIFFKAR